MWAGGCACWRGGRARGWLGALMESCLLIIHACMHARTCIWAGAGEDEVDDDDDDGDGTADNDGFDSSSDDSDDGDDDDSRRGRRLDSSRRVLDPECKYCRSMLGRLAAYLHRWRRFVAE